MKMRTTALKRNTLIKNQIFHYTRCITPKRVTSLRGPSPRYCARATLLLSKKCRSGGKPLATLCQILLARDLNPRPPGPRTNALPLDHGKVNLEKTMYRLPATLIACIRRRYSGSQFVLSRPLKSK